MRNPLLLFNTDGDKHHNKRNVLHQVKLGIKGVLPRKGIVKENRNFCQHFFHQQKTMGFGFIALFLRKIINFPRIYPNSGITRAERKADFFVTVLRFRKIVFYESPRRR